MELDYQPDWFLINKYAECKNFTSGNWIEEVTRRNEISELIDGLLCDAEAIANGKEEDVLEGFPSKAEYLDTILSMENEVAEFFSKPIHKKHPTPSFLAGAALAISDATIKTSLEATINAFNGVVDGSALSKAIDGGSNSSYLYGPDNTRAVLSRLACSRREWPRRTPVYTPDYAFPLKNGLESRIGEALGTDHLELNLNIDLSYSNAELIEQFKSKLSEARERTRTKKNQMLLSKELERLVSSRVLPYYDLLLWERYSRTSFTQPQLARLIFPDLYDVDLSDKLRKGTMTVYDQLFMQEYLFKRLIREAKAELKSTN